MSETEDGDIHATGTHQEQREDLPFNCEYEIGVQEANDEGEWDFFHPLARTEEEAKELAIDEAAGVGFADPEVYSVTGPYKPKDPIRVGHEMIEEVFGE